MYKIEAHDLATFHLPRWDELPNIELYIDQVIAILEDTLYILKKDKSSPIITTSMINNYVKNKIIKAPIKKKYDKDQLAHLIVICIYKRILSLYDIKEALRFMKNIYAVPDAYNMFCDELERALKIKFDENYVDKEIDDENEIREISTLKALSMAIADTLLVDKLIALRNTITE